MNYLQMQLFDIQIFNKIDFLELLLRFSFHLFVLFVLVMGIYHRRTKQKQYSFTFFLIGVVVFLICFMLESVKIQLGFALGLFAIFGIIRYRTVSVPIKEMTYLFMIVGIAIINSITTKQLSYVELIFANSVILLITYILERQTSNKNYNVITVIYNKPESINLQHQSELIKELEQSTGLNIEKIKIETIDYQKNEVKIKVYF